MEINKTVTVTVDDEIKEQIDDAHAVLAMLYNNLFKIKDDIPETIKVLEDAKKVLANIKKGNALT